MSVPSLRLSTMASKLELTDIRVVPQPAADGVVADPAVQVVIAAGAGDVVRQPIADALLGAPQHDQVLYVDRQC